MGEWKRVKLGDISLVTKLAGYEFTKYMKYVPDGEIIAVRALNLRDGTLDLSDVKRIERSVSLSLPRSQLHVGDIVLSYTGTIGACAYINANDTYHLAPNVAKIEPRQTVVCPQFIFNYIRGDEFQQQLRDCQHGSTQPTIPMAEIRELQIPVPPLPTQRRIAAFLGALDDKIEVNRKICENLEAQAQALFKAWFVDFEPFKGTMVDDSLWGEHPKELEYVRVGDLNPVLETGSRPKGGAATSGIPSIGAENVKQLGVFDFGSKKYIPVEFAQKLKRGKIQGYELLLYKDGGKPGMFKPHFSMFGEGFPYEECYINEHVFKVDFGSCETNVFAYFYFKSQYVFSWLETNGAKAAIPGINQANVLDVMMPDPKHALVKQFGEKVLPVFKMIFIKCKESRALAAMRDALLPKLMSGELAVEKVEGF